ncbi:MAG: hypothetical protein ACOCUL_01565 [Bacteroidota bacterium]
MIKLPEKIRTIDNSEPHESWGGWKKFLKKDCEIRDTHEGVIFFGSVNCNYIVFPDGLLIQNCGFHGNVLMNHIKEEGVKAVEESIIQDHKKISDLLNLIKITSPAARKPPNLFVGSMSVGRSSTTIALFPRARSSFAWAFITSLLWPYSPVN